MRDLVIGSMTGYDFGAIRLWVNSLDRCGFTGRKAMIVYNSDFETVEELTRRGFTIFSFEKDERQRRYHFADSFSVSVLRFFHIWSFLSQLDLSEYRYLIATDVRDLVFQTNPSDWLEENLGEKKINVGSESLRYKHEEWNRNSMLEDFGPVVYQHMQERPVFNAGSIAGEASVMRDLALCVALVGMNKQDYSDQAAMNVLLSLEPFKRLTNFARSEDGWACQAGTTVYPDRIDIHRPHLLEPEPVFDGDFVYTSSGKRFCIVHQYDRVPRWTEAFRARYG